MLLDQNTAGTTYFTVHATAGMTDIECNGYAETSQSLSLHKSVLLQTLLHLVNSLLP